MSDINLTEGKSYEYNFADANVNGDITFTIRSDSAIAGVDYNIESNVTVNSSDTDSTTYSLNEDTLTIKAIDDSIYDPMKIKILEMLLIETIKPLRSREKTVI